MNFRHTRLLRQLLRCVSFAQLHGQASVQDSAGESQIPAAIANSAIQSPTCAFIARCRKQRQPVC